jgi:hypothetical protein
VIHPDYPGENNWFNTTSEMGIGPAGSAGMMAFDPLLGTQGGEMVYFGGCDRLTGCPSNVTWLYDGYSWSNLSKGKAPPAVEFGMMAYDPVLGGVLLIGGINSTGATSAGIWEYSASGWSDLTSTGWGSGRPSSGIAYATMAWDPVLDEMLVVGGCSAECSNPLTAAWGVNATGWGTFYYMANECTVGASMAWDSSSRVMVLFGGETGGTSFVPSYCSTTWVLNDTNWSYPASVPSDGTPSSATPPALAFASMTWDGQLNSVILFGGSDFAGTAYNTTWSFSLPTGWVNASRADAYSDPKGTYFPAMAVDSTDQAPLLIDGSCSLVNLSGGCEGQEAVLDVAPSPQALNLSPTWQADVNDQASFLILDPAHCGSGPWLFINATWGDGTTPRESEYLLIDGSAFILPVSHTYASTGSFTLNVTFEDFFDVFGNLSAVVTVVADPQATASGLPSPTEVGTPVDFVGTVSLGTPPYRYAWSFGGGSRSNNSSVRHTYSAPGYYYVFFNGTDSLGAVSHMNFVIEVYPRLVANAQASLMTLDAGVSDSFSATLSGGSGAYPTETWSFGDGGTASGSTTSHIFSTTATNGSQTFDVAFTVIDSLHFERTATLSVAVNPALEAAPTFSPSSAEPGSPVSFSTGLTGGTAPFFYAWLFGDGSNGSGPSATHIYLTAGSYTVHLRVNDSGGGSIEKTLTVVVAESSTAGSPKGGEGLLVGGLIVVIVAGVALAVLLAIRRRRKPTGAQLSAPLHDLRRRAE